MSSTTDFIVQDINKELKKAKRKFPKWSDDPLHALTVIGEEFGELTKECLQYMYEPEKTNFSDIRKEAIQTGAMILRFIESLDRDKYCWNRNSDQHNSEEEDE